MFSRISLKIDFTEQFNRFAAISNNLPNTISLNRRQQINHIQIYSFQQSPSDDILIVVGIFSQTTLTDYHVFQFGLRALGAWHRRDHHSYVYICMYIHMHVYVRTYITQSNPKNPFQGINLSLFAFLSLSCASFLRLLLLFLHTFFITSLFFSCFLMKKYVLLLLPVCQIAPTFSQLLPQHNRCLYVLFFYSFIPFGKCFILLPKSHNIKPESIYE